MARTSGCMHRTSNARWSTLIWQPADYAFLIEPIAAEALAADDDSGTGGEGGDTLDAAALGDWFCSRARQIDERSGQLHLAAELLEVAVSFGFAPYVNPLLMAVQQLGALVYELSCPARLAEFVALSAHARLKLLLSHAPVSGEEEGGEKLAERSGGRGVERNAQRAFSDFCRDHVLPFLQRQPHGARLLREYTVRRSFRLLLLPAAVSC